MIDSPDPTATLAEWTRHLDLMKQEAKTSEGLYKEACKMEIRRARKMIDKKKAGTALDSFRRP